MYIDLNSNSSLSDLHRVSIGLDDKMPISKLL